MKRDNVGTASSRFGRPKKRFKFPVRALCSAFIASVVYLSAQAYLSFPTSVALHEPIAAPLVQVQPELPAILYDHPLAPVLVSMTIEYGDTLGGLLTKSGVATQDINRIVTCGGPCRELHQLQPGSTLVLRLNQDRQLLSVSQTLAHGQTRQFSFHNDHIDVTATYAEREYVKAVAHVIIRAGESPISAAKRSSGLMESTVLRATQILEYDIDFWRNIRPNDEFEIYYEQVYVNQVHVQDGDIFALRFTSRGKLYEAYLHSDGLHYEADGAAIQKQFLQAPLRYKRISSNFSNARKHPILGYTRAHRGVDYAAPRGTPVRSTADGVVTYVKRNDPAAGNFLAIQHANGFETRYLHLSGFARGIARGSRITRGHTIGYVGSTGLSTGPHLHYEVIQHGHHINPLSVPNPSVESLEGIQRDRFLASVQNYIRIMDRFRNEQQIVEPVAIVPQ